FGRSALPLREKGQHILRGHCLLTHARRRSLHSHDHATVVVHQIVVVVTQSGRSSTLGGESRIGICSRDLILLMHRLFGGILLLEFDQILTHGVVHLRRFH